MRLWSRGIPLIYLTHLLFVDALVFVSFPYYAVTITVTFIVDNLHVYLYVCCITSLRYTFTCDFYVPIIFGCAALVSGCIWFPFHTYLRIGLRHNRNAQPWAGSVWKKLKELPIFRWIIFCSTSQSYIFKGRACCTSKNKYCIRIWPSRGSGMS